MKRMDTINVIPFIDIMLVLLAIVLTTATFIVEGRLDIRLPEAEGSTAAPIDPIELAIDREGSLFWAGKPLDDRALLARLDDLSRDTPLVLRVDADARFGAFVGLVDALKARRLERLTILTRRP